MGCVRRGEIWLIGGGVYASKPRPAVILQSDRFGTESVTVCPCTTTDVDAPMLRMPIPADEGTGLRSASFLMVDKVTTVRRSNVTRRVGALSRDQVTELDRRILVFLGFAG